MSESWRRVNGHSRNNLEMVPMLAGLVNMGGVRVNGTEVYNILRDKGVTLLHHANTVTTSCTFLRIGGLASRGYVEDHDLPQTPQYSDDADKRLGIWYDVFLDGVDIHERARVPNDYGPVLFMLPTTILIDLPPGTDVLVTRTNPVHWGDGGTPGDRYFMSPQQLREEYTYGDFGKHVILRIKGGFLQFPGSPLGIQLDDPGRKLPNGTSAYTRAARLLKSSAEEGGLLVNISKRQCAFGCRCQSGDKRSYDRQTDIDTRF